MVGEQLGALAVVEVVGPSRSGGALTRGEKGRWPCGQRQDENEIPSQPPTGRKKRKGRGQERKRERRNVKDNCICSLKHARLFFSCAPYIPPLIFMTLYLSWH